MEPKKCQCGPGCTCDPCTCAPGCPGNCGPKACCKPFPKFCFPQARVLEPAPYFEGQIWYDGMIQNIKLTDLNLLILLNLISESKNKIYSLLLLLFFFVLEKFAFSVLNELNREILL